MRKLRASPISFGGVLVLGTMDHTQIQPINQLPFLTSSVNSAEEGQNLVGVLRTHKHLGGRQ